MAKFEIKNGVGIIPDGTTNIPDYAFSGAAELSSINIPDSVTEIGICAFEGCTSLTNVVLPSSVTMIEEARASHKGTTPNLCHRIGDDSC